MTSLALDRPRQGSLFSGEIPRAALVVAAALIVVRIATAGIGLPLWLDETFSATIAVQPTIGGLLDWCLNELSGPFYYSLLWLWEKLVGDSDAALRLPGQALALVTPLVLLWKGHPDREVRRLWALTVGLWPFGFELYITARPSGMVILLGCVQAVCFLQLMRAPDLRRAAYWSLASGLAILTHYHALVITAIEALAYLFTWRVRAIRTWPGALPFLPVGGWMAFHLATVLHYANSGQTWYQLLGPRDLLVIPLFLLGGYAMLVVVAILLAVTARYRVAEGQPVLRWSPETALVGAGLLASAIIVTIGMVRPTFHPRYLLADLGAVSLLIPLLLRAARPLVPMAPLAAVLLMLGGASSQLLARIAHPDGAWRYALNYETASGWIMASQPRTGRLVFLWDNPTALMGKADKLAQVGGFFLRRAGATPEVVIPRYALGADPWPAVRAGTAGRGDSAVIWIADDNVPMTSKLSHPIAILHDPDWTCRDFGQAELTVLACVRRKPA